MALQQQSPSFQKSEILRTYSNLHHAKKMLEEVQRIGVVQLPKTTLSQVGSRLVQVRKMIKFKK